MKTWDEMTPRERDKVVAEEVMGWSVIESETHTPYVRHERPGGAHFRIIGPGDWSPSTEIAHAWEVVEKITDPPRTALRLSVSKAGVFATFYSLTSAATEAELRGSARYEAVADTAPLAICLAALRAKGVDV